MALIGSNGDKDLNELWHRRMGHLQHGALRIFRKTVSGVPELSTEWDDVCRGYALGKYAKVAFSRSSNRAKSVPGLIHSDICEPMCTKDLSGVEYFITFIDDHSKKTWIYFLKTKDEVFDQFKEFMAPVENLTGKKIKVLCLDNGGEYVDKDFTDFCAKEDIKREWIAPYNPEHNRLAERKNRTIVEAARAMLYDHDMPKFLWASTCSTAVYVQNKTPQMALGKIAPKKVFTRKTPEVNHFKIFVSLTYCRIPKEKRKKLDQTANKGYLVEYSKNTKAYRVYLPSSRKVVVLKFMEDRAFKKS